MREMVREVFLFIRKDRLYVLARQTIAIEDSLLDGDVFFALQLAEAPDTPNPGTATPM